MDKNIYKKTGAVLKKARKQKNLTLEDVAKIMGKSKSWIGDIESGRNRIYFDDILKLCELYEADIDDIAKKVDN
ncbi:MAG: helix-turn-helix domain-containing protein [Faecalibacillus faecis]|jgi:transcriptional regulator with XRE-family HTH domain|uniref:helix-turn-helix domain-containing protein n=1 Tax=Faecalibacillus faecis TaxID=1982628 RepID=UPI0039951926